VTELQRENHVLKDLVKVEMAGDGGADEILAKCQSDLGSVVMSSDNGHATSLLEKQGTCTANKNSICDKFKRIESRSL